MKEESTAKFSTAEVAQQAGVHKDTLLRWLRKGLVKEPSRDRNGWRVFSESEASEVLAYSRSEAIGSRFSVPVEDTGIAALGDVDWDFQGAKTNYLTHRLHPYPAKFIPQIPNAIIQELSRVGDTIGDIFCGSGTTLVEALTLKRHAVGVDANPLAGLISRAKTTILTESDKRELLVLSTKVENLLASVQEIAFSSTAWRPSFAKLDFWFETFVIEELSELLALCRDISSSRSKTVALATFSSIVVAVSKQDSDTRYVRREKGLKPGDATRRFLRALSQSIEIVSEFSDLVEPRFDCTVVEKSLLDRPILPTMDLMVCSPPYPNAYSYHLYHMTRMVWLGMDQPKFKTEEIGSHRKYSKKGADAATADTFFGEFIQIFEWLKTTLKLGKYACFVVGDSTLAGKRVSNADLISGAAKGSGFVEVARLDRTMQATKKSFNPKIGRIKQEQVLILKNGD